MARWERPLFSFIYRYVQDREAANELTQETFVRVYQARAGFDARHAFSSWMFRIAANLCRNHQRWRRRHPEELLGEDDPCLSTRRGELTPAGLLLRDEQLLALRQAVLRMPHPLKAALLLHYYEGLSYAEIAGVVGCSPRGVAQATRGEGGNGSCG